MDSGCGFWLGFRGLQPDSSAASGDETDVVFERERAADAKIFHGHGHQNSSIPAVDHYHSESSRVAKLRSKIAPESCQMAVRLAA